MADRGKYVDIFFRNGLKEYEVLPPPDVWDNIKPVLKKRQRSLTFFRIAAMSAILVSLSAFSVWLTRELSKEFDSPSISLNQDAIPEGSFVQKNKALISSPVEQAVLKNELPPTLAYIEKPTSEPVFLKMPSNGLFTSAFNENKLQKPDKTLVPSVSIPGSISILPKDEIDLSPGVAESGNATDGINRWSISAMASPNYYSSVSFGDNQASNELVKGEKPAVSYSGGMSFSYKVNKRMSIQSGLYYSSMGQKVAGISSYSGFSRYYNAKSSSEFSIQTSSGMIVSNNNNIFLRDNVSARVMTKYTADFFDPSKANLSYLNNSVIQNFNYLEIPVLFKYKAIDRKMDLNFVGGISYNMLVGNSAFAYDKGIKYSIGKTEGLSQINFSSSIGLGFEYSISEKISLNLEPTFRYYLTPIGGLVGSSVHPYSFGVFSGLSYKF
jgi:hypothetical protein